MDGYSYKQEDFSLDNQELLLQETLFHNANGYLGVRGNFEEGYPKDYLSIRGTYLNGFYDDTKMKQAESLYGLAEEKQIMLNVADTQGINLYVEDESFDLFEGTVIKKERVLRMDQGITVRDVIWRSPQGREIQVTIKRMASFELLPLFFVEYELTPLNFSGKVRILSKHNGEVKNFCDPTDPRVSAESHQHLFVDTVEIEGDTAFVTSHTGKSGLLLCSATANEVEGVDCERNIKQSETGCDTKIYLEAETGKTVRLYKYSVFCDSLRYENPREAAAEVLYRARKMGAKELYRLQERYLKHFWERSVLEIEGDEEMNLAVRYNMYQLLQSAGKEKCANIGAKGLSGEGYEGHYFWDTEMYLLPFFIMTNKTIARNLIQNRYHMLGAAKQNAKLLGHKKGALYPWRTITGKECSGHYPSGTAQYHISGDIAYGVISYYLATKDVEFIEAYGAEIVIETARLWMDTGTEWKGKFCINEVTGPDEYTCMVNNNYYTNALAQFNLRWAAKFGDMLLRDSKSRAKELGICQEELKEFQTAAENMYLPYDDKLGINPQDDSFLQKKVWYVKDIKEEEKPLLLHYHPLHLYRHQICKQADTVLAHVIFDGIESEDVVRNTFHYYEKITTHDSSLSTCIFSIAASALGMEEKAFAYFGESAKMDLFNTHKNTKDGIHTANMGGTYMAILYGFGGVRIRETGLYLKPVLPKSWSGYRFRIEYEGVGMEVRVSESKCVMKHLYGESKTVYVYGEPYILKDILEIERSVRK